EIYDPKTKQFTPGPSMTDGRDSQTATMLLGGNVLVTGGDAASDSPLATAEIYGLPLGATCQNDNECASNACFQTQCCDSPCNASKQYCDTGACTPKKPDGEPAAAPNECISGLVSDGVCCDKACTNKPCEVCSAAAGATQDGTCTNTTVSCD